MTLLFLYPPPPLRFAGPRRFEEFDPGLTPSPDTIRHIADALAPDLREAFLTAVERLGAAISLAALEAALERGGTAAVAGVLEAVTTDGFADALTVAVKDMAMQAVGKAGAATAAKLGMRFDLTNPHAIRWADQHASKLVTQVTNDTKAGIRVIVRAGQAGDGTVRQQAEQIKALVGLTDRDAQAVVNYRARLTDLAARLDLSRLSQADAGRLQRGGMRVNQLPKLRRTGLDASRVDGLVDAYQQRLIKERAVRIARTEGIRSANMGQQIAWRQAGSRGLLDLSSVQRVWIASANACPVCVALNGKAVAFEESFTHTTDAGVEYTALTPPAHPMCRCTVGISR